MRRGLSHRHGRGRRQKRRGRGDESGVQGQVENHVEASARSPKPKHHSSFATRTHLIPTSRTNKNNPCVLDGTQDRHPGAIQTILGNVNSPSMVYIERPCWHELSLFVAFAVMIWDEASSAVHGQASHPILWLSLALSTIRWTLDCNVCR